MRRKRDQRAGLPMQPQSPPSRPWLSRTTAPISTTFVSTRKAVEDYIGLLVTRTSSGWRLCAGRKKSLARKKALHSGFSFLPPYAKQYSSSEFYFNRDYRVSLGFYLPGASASGGQKPGECEGS